MPRLLSFFSSGVSNPTFDFLLPYKNLDLSVSTMQLFTPKRNLLIQPGRSQTQFLVFHLFIIPTDHSDFWKFSTQSQLFALIVILYCPAGASSFLEPYNGTAVLILFPFLLHLDELDATVALHDRRDILTRCIVPHFFNPHEDTRVVADDCGGRGLRRSFVLSLGYVQHFRLSLYSFPVPFHTDLEGISLNLDRYPGTPEGLFVAFEFNKSGASEFPQIPEIANHANRFNPTVRFKPCRDLVHNLSHRIELERFGIDGAIQANVFVGDWRDSPYPQAVFANLKILQLVCLFRYLAHGCIQSLHPAETRNDFQADVALRVLADF
mmetsp:Transcript_49078/g.122711  ORF Transcript_49078/g.122711 Transcript_49078/m.122711 type:complete len:323 (+) Transcript_49078:1392-2360(+)